MAKLRVVEDGITKKLNEMLDRSKTVRSFLNTTIYTMYQNFQMQRWMTEGSSESSNWAPLNPIYAKYKLRRYGGGTQFKWVGGRGQPGMPWEPVGTWGNYPGSGTKMMVGTSRLISAVIGPNDTYTEGLNYHRKVVDSDSITIGVDVSEEASKKDQGSKYFEYADEKRDFTYFSAAHYQQMKYALLNFIRDGKTG